MLWRLLVRRVKSFKILKELLARQEMVDEFGEDSASIIY